MSEQSKIEFFFKKVSQKVYDLQQQVAIEKHNVYPRGIKTVLCTRNHLAKRVCEYWVWERIKVLVRKE
jgi:hypothetical protein